MLGLELKRYQVNRKQYSLPIKILLLMITGLMGPLFILTIFNYIRFHDVMFGKDGVLSSFYAISILLSLSFIGYIVQEIMKPISALKQNIEAYRAKKFMPNLKGITEAEEFNYLFDEYEKLINEIEHRERELVEKARLATIGTMATMIAHDVRKPLTAIQMFLQLFPTDGLGADEKIVSEIKESIVCTNAMLNDILEFSHEVPQLNFKNCNIKALIAKALEEFFHVKATAKINFFYDFNHGDKNIYVDDLRVIRVLVNVLENSLDAMENITEKQKQGNILFRTKYVEKNDKCFINLMVIDDGVGIPTEIAKKIYDPFFSYGKSNGNGLGLSICKNIMIAHGGDIIVKNRSDSKGVEVSLLFVEGAALRGDDDIKLVANSRVLFLENKKTFVQKKNKKPITCLTNDQRNKLFSVLIVDDEYVVKSMLRNLISSSFECHKSYKIEDASSAEEALIKLKNYDFNCIITDIDFGTNRINGYDFTKIVLEQYKNSYVIIHSNKLDMARDKKIKKIFAERFLGSVQKPVTKKELVEFFSVFISTKTYKHTKALLVNDDNAIAFSMKKILERYDIETCCVTNIADAANKFLGNNFDFILSDINLGNEQENGYVFLEKVRSLNKTIPFIMMSGYNKEQEQKKAIMLGATTYIQMPFKIENLLRVLQ